jgi:hypothetical protein
MFPNPFIEYMKEGGCDWSHPKSIAHMGVEYNQLGEECESRKVGQREEICMGWDNNFTQLSFVHEEQVERKK